MDGKTSNFRQEIRYSYYRNDPVKYDLNLNYVSFENKRIPSYSAHVDAGPENVSISPFLG